MTTVATDQKITPLLWFEGDGEEAAQFYVSIFDSSGIDSVRRYGEAGPGPAGSAMMIEFHLEGQAFMALNGGPSQPSGTAPTRGSIALFVTCDTQADLDRKWERLAQGGEILQCGWLRDRYGVAWNLVPAGMSDVLHGDDPVKSDRAMQAMLQMKKLDIEALRRAYDGV